SAGTVPHAASVFGVCSRSRIRAAGTSEELGNWWALSRDETCRAAAPDRPADTEWLAGARLLYGPERLRHTLAATRDACAAAERTGRRAEGFPRRSACVAARRAGGGDGV